MNLECLKLVCIGCQDYSRTRKRSTWCIVRRCFSAVSTLKVTEFLDRIITKDETWLHHFDPETKAMSSVWKTPKTPPPKKARVQKSAGKHMFIFFMDQHGMILRHRVPEGQTVTAAY